MATRKEVLEVGGREVTVSNPDKVYFPVPGYTKLDVVTYFLSIADGALAGVRGRPMALKRFVDGIDKEPFFQKRAPDNRPEWMRVATLTFPSGRTADEIVVDEAAGLAWVANLGCIDLNPHPVRADDLDHPDELRVDLDPVPGVPWSQVREVAGVVHEALDAVGLVGWPKTSGSRGIHVNVRIEPPLDLRRGPAGGAGAGPRRRAARPVDRDLEVVEGGAPRGVPRLQPERQGPDGRLRVLGPAARRRAGLVPAALGRGGRRRRRGLHAGDGPGAVRRSAATPARGSTRPSARWTRCSSSRARDEAEGLGDAPWPPNYAKQEGEPPRVQPSKKRKPDEAYEGRGKDGGPPPEVAAERAAAVAAGDRNAGLPTEWEGTRPTPTGRRKSSIPVIEIARAATKAEVNEGLERWKARHPEVVEHLEPADILTDGMRGRAYVWYRLRVNLIHVPEDKRPAQEPLDPDYNPWEGYEWPDQSGQPVRAPKKKPAPDGAPGD